MQEDVGHERAVAGSEAIADRSIYSNASVLRWFFGHLQSICAIIVATISIVVLLATFIGWLAVAKVGPNYVPMTVMTAVMALTLAAVLYSYSSDRPRPQSYRVAKIAVCAVILVAFSPLIELVTNAPLDLGRYFTVRRQLVEGYDIRLTSPLSAVSLMAAGASLLLLLSTRPQSGGARTLAPLLALSVTGVGFVASIGYAYGAPLLYGGEIKPMALLTSLSLSFLGVGIIASGGFDCWPARSFVGSSVKARMFRVFLPMTVAVVFAEGWLTFKASSAIGNPSIESAVMAFIAAMFVIAIVSRLSLTIGGQIDRSNALRREAEEKLRVSNDKLNAMASITRHDLLNQLMALRYYLEKSRKGIDDPEALKNYETMDELTSHMQEFMVFTRDYQMIGGESPRWIAVDEAFSKGVHSIHHDGVSITCGVEGIEIFADRMLEKVFINLIDDSIKHGGTVKNIGLNSDRAGPHLVLIYQDDGAGIPREDRARLFERGFGKHSGLGLNLSKEILGFTGISISENGEPGKGVRFEIVVPEGNYRYRTPQLPGA